MYKCSGPYLRFLKHGVDRVSDLCEGGHSLGSETVGKVGLCVAIFEVSEIRCRLEFLICVKECTLSVSRWWEGLDYVWPYFKVLKSSVDLSFRFV